MSLVDALKKLDVNNDNHWTMQGEPRLDTVRFLNSGASVTREDIELASPGFNRETYRAMLAGQAPPPPPSAIEDITNGPQVSGTGSHSVVDPEPSKVEDRTGDGETVFEAVAQAFDQANERVIELERVQAEVGQELKAARFERDRLHDEKVKMQPPEDNQSVIQKYLNQQKINLDNRAQAQMAIANSGINLNALTKMSQRAPIDQARMMRPRQTPKR